MKLEVHERIALLGLLPKEGDYAALKEYRRAREMISFTAEEIQFYGMTSQTDAHNQTIHNWNAAKAREQIKDIPFSEYMTSVIRKELADLERKKKLSESTYSLFEKFVIMYQ